MHCDIEVELQVLQNHLIMERAVIGLELKVKSTGFQGCCKLSLNVEVGDVVGLGGDVLHCASQLPLEEGVLVIAAGSQ